MWLQLFFRLLAIGHTWARPDDDGRATRGTAPDGVDDDGITGATVYPIMQGFDIYTFPEHVTPPTPDQILKLQADLQMRFRHVSSDEDHSLYDLDQGFCHMEVGTHVGGNCYVKITPEKDISGNDTLTVRGLEDSDGYPEDACSWVDFDAPPPTAILNDPGVGDYGIRYTATSDASSITYQGLSTLGGGGGHRCQHEGLCFPQLVFYRRNYRLVLSTWHIPVAQREFCQWDGANEIIHPIIRYQLCVDDTFGQYEGGGAHFRYNCSVPCWNDGNLDVEQPHLWGGLDERVRDPEWNETAANWNWVDDTYACTMNITR